MAAFDLREHPFFESWTDPESGVESFILTERVAPVQQSFYFTNPSVSGDERWLWFYAAFPPAPYRSLGVVSLDPAKPFVRHFPGAAFSDASPMVAKEGDAIYFCSQESVWRLPIDGEPEVVCTLGEEFIRKRPLRRLATHLTTSADGKHFLLDGAIGNHWFVAVGERDTGEVKVLKEFGRHYNHAQFSPTDPGLFSIAQDWWNDPVSGDHFPFDQRIWLMDVGGSRFEPLRPRDWFGHGTNACHEWWSPDGLVCWVDYEQGAFECDVSTREAVKVWRGPLCHAHCDSTRRYWCADESPYKWRKTPCQVRFYDRESSREVNIVTALPLPPHPRRWYHLDPHPQFSPGGTWVVYTTTVRGQVDVALAPVDGMAG